MALNAFLFSMVAAIVALLLVFGIVNVLFPKPLWQRYLTPLWIRGDRWMRKYWPGYEKAAVARGGLFIPSDIVLETREDYYDYISSERPWELRWMRLWHRAAGAFLIFCALVFIGALINNPP